MTAAAYDGVELFGGPGGTSLAAQRLGLHLLGVENDAAACATRRAAGHPTLQADVLKVDPAPFVGCAWEVGSPPCQPFSQAGKGSGRRQLDLLLRAVARLGQGQWPAAEIEATHDPRTALVLEPLRWAMVCEPQRVMLEQVPGVLPVWEAMAVVLRSLGYTTWTGKLQAEEYGVAQTRERAILMARRDGKPVAPPAPTHRAYSPFLPDGGRYGDGTGSLFGDDLLPWVSMADALGWGMTARPGMTVACSRDSGGPDKEKVGGSAARAVLYAERDAGRWRVNTGRDWKEGGTREDAQSFDPEARPAPAVDTKGRWQVSAVVAERLNDQTGTPVDLEWPDNRPATVVAGRDLVQHPGATANRHNDSTKSRNDGIRVTLEEAAALQGFPDGYPWQGNRSKRFQQVGNAVPPPLAEAVLRALL